MARRIVSCFIVLCLVLSISLFFVFNRGTFPAYRTLILSEVEKTADIQRDALQNGILAPIDQMIAQIVSDTSGGQELSSLAEKSAFSMRDALPSLRFLEGQSTLTSSLFSSIDLYMERSGMFLSSHYGVLSKDDVRSPRFFPWFTQFDFNSDYDMSVSAYTIELTGSLPVRYVAFSRPLFLQSGGGSNACIISFVMDVSVLQRILNAADEALYIEDHFGNRFALSEELSVDSDDLYWSSYTSGGLRIARVLPTARIDAQLSSIQHAILPAILIICAVSCLFGLLAVWSATSPFRKMVHHLEQQYTNASEGSTEKGELATFLHIVSNLSAQASHLQSALKQSQDMAQKNLLNAMLLTHDSNEESLARQMEQCEFSFSYPLFTVMSIRFTFSGEPNMDPQSLRMMRISLLTQLSEVHAAGRFAIYPLENGQTSLAVILNHLDPDGLSICRDIVKFLLTDNPDVRRILTIGVSQTQNRPVDLNIAFQQAQAAQAQKFCSPNEIFFAYMTEADDPSPLDIERELHTFHKYLNAGNTLGALLFIRDLLEHLDTPLYSQRLSKRLEPFFAPLRMQGLLPQNTYSLDEVRQHIAQQTEQMKQPEKNARPSKRQQAIEDAIAYIDQHISDAVSLSETAEAVGLSTSYLSRTFKESVGENFNEYVNTRRMLAAQHLLLTTDTTIDDIAISLGFTTSNYFIKRFKQYFGETPAAYRTSHRNTTESSNNKLPHDSSRSLT